MPPSDDEQQSSTTKLRPYWEPSVLDYSDDTQQRRSRVQDSFTNGKDASAQLITSRGNALPSRSHVMMAGSNFTSFSMVVIR